MVTDVVFVGRPLQLNRVANVYWELGGREIDHRHASDSEGGCQKAGVNGRELHDVRKNCVGDNCEGRLLQSCTRRYFIPYD